ncbi:MAG: hypothetical protein QOI53_2318, partial [Verrucomicrobiota bacterium]|nr:hypothetical protein [Verrucomicrobiota bacterium]
FLEANKSVLERFPLIELIGPADYSRLLKIPNIEATIDTGKTSQTAPAKFLRMGSNYEIVVDTSSLQLPAVDQISIKLNFDSFFLPRRKGSGHDERELVVKAPSLVQLARR